MKVAVIGAGFVGLTTAISLTEKGNQVSLIEIDESRFKSLQNGKVPFYEPGMDQAFKDSITSGNLTLCNWENATSLEAEVAIICGGTPSNSDGSINLDQIFDITEKCSEHLKNTKNIVVKSTVLPGTTRNLQDKDRNSGGDKNYAMVPEFLREGSALHDARNPDRIVIGSQNENQIETLSKLFFHENVKQIITSPYNAEIIKYAANSFLATCISFANDFFSIVNKDSDFELNHVLEGWFSDRRLMVDGRVAPITSYLKPGFGFGGSCFPKDVKAIASFAKTINPKSHLISSVLEANNEALNKIFDWLTDCLNKDEKILLLGIAFKENSDDLRESPSIKLAKLLIDEGFNLAWYDPWVREPNSITNALQINADKIQEFSQIIWSNNDSALRSALENLEKQNSRLFLLRYQSEIEGFMNVYPRKAIADE